MSKKGSVLVRRNLYLSSLSAIRYNDIIKEKYNRLIKSGKIKKVALGAVMAHIFRAIVFKFNEYNQKAIQGI